MPVRGLRWPRPRGTTGLVLSRVKFAPFALFCFELVTFHFETGRFPLCFSPLINAFATFGRFVDLSPLCELLSDLRYASIKKTWDR